MNTKLPVLILAFNRPDHIEHSMKVLQEYKPDRLYLACDGPRHNKAGEAEIVDATRKKMLEMVTWPCTVKTLFREKNLGCANGVFNAISWFFEHEEYGVICEDDVILSQDFFKLCEDLLVRYQNTDRIMEISAENRSGRLDIPNSYTYSLCQRCWGWATWRRAWEKMDMKMNVLDRLTIFDMIGKMGFFHGIYSFIKTRKIKKNLDTYNSWAIRWFYSILEHDGLVISPGKNLAKNIGIDGGSHYEKGDVDPYSNLECENIEWPLVYNDRIEIDEKQKKFDIKDFNRLRLIGLKKFIKKKCRLFLDF